jgi:hypothetical protein
MEDKATGPAWSRSARSIIATTAYRPLVLKRIGLSTGFGHAER